MITCPERDLDSIGVRPASVLIFPPSGLFFGVATFWLLLVGGELFFGAATFWLFLAGGDFAKVVGVSAAELAGSWISGIAERLHHHLTGDPSILQVPVAWVAAV